MFLFFCLFICVFITHPPSLSIPIAVSVSFSFPLPPPLQFPVHPALQKCSTGLSKAALSPGALNVGLRSPRSWHPAEGKRAEREPPCPCGPSCAAHARAAHPANCSGAILWACFGLSTDKITLSSPFFPSSPGCILPFPRASNTAFFATLVS